MGETLTSQLTLTAIITDNKITMSVPLCVCALEYALSLCAKSIVKKGGVIQKEYLLKIDTHIPLAPCGKAWTHELAKQQFNSEQISKKEYGYIVANIDMGFSVVNECSHDQQINKGT